MKIKSMNFPAPVVTSLYDARISGSGAGDPFLTPANGIVDQSANRYYPLLFPVTQKLNYVGSYNVYANGPSEWELNNADRDWSGAYRSGLLQMDEVLNDVPAMKVYIGTGYYDSICVSGSVDYLIHRLSTKSATDRVQLFHFPSGHVIYAGSENAARLHAGPGLESPKSSSRDDYRATKNRMEQTLRWSSSISNA